MNQRTKNDFLLLSTQPRLKEQFTPKREKSSYLLTNIDGTFLQLHSETTLQHSPLKITKQKGSKQHNQLRPRLWKQRENKQDFKKDVFLKQKSLNYISRLLEIRVTPDEL